MKDAAVFALHCRFMLSLKPLKCTHIAPFEVRIEAHVVYWLCVTVLFFVTGCDSQFDSRHVLFFAAQSRGR